jgi:glyoxylase-like metal-dependent hydrolase (beta-lactamase superfamily II)
MFARYPLQEGAFMIRQTFTAIAATALSTTALTATIGAAGLAALGLAPALGQDDQQVYVETIDLGAGLYMLATNRAGNVGVSVGEDGVFMIDTQMADLAPAIDRAQRAVSGDRAVDLVLNTHLHGDHVLGNAYFAEAGATIMAHESVREALMNPVTAQLTGATPAPLSGAFLPTVSVSHGDAATLNGEAARFHHAPSAHTGGDLFVVFDGADVIHAGDLLFSGMFPYIDLDNGGTVEGMIAGLRQVAEAAGPDTQIIPGHGPLSTKDDVVASANMLEATRAVIAGLVDEGLSYEEILQSEPLADWHEDWNWGFITTERMIWTHYRDLTGETP